ncbi:MAG: acyl-ACP--UDP-N-acetylglucosamine O-acyltransferase [Synergistaceae bacterium]|nr:acyl-ACP--UDP-N-acetylglucosamine O-acyltransferase [Synergistaceae bacterium]
MSVVIDKTAIVDKRAKLGENVNIGPFCLVAGDVEIGDGTSLKAFVSIHDRVVIGSNCSIAEYTAIGGDPQDHGYKGEPTWVKIGNNNIIRENVTINHATGEGNETLVGNDCFIMDCVHLAHNVHVGNYVTIANKVGLSGFVQVGDHTVFGGMAGVHQFVRIGEYCMIGGLYRVVKDVPHYTLASGEPLRLTGLNSVGLKRGGFDAEKRRAILNFYKELYDKNDLFTHNLNKMRVRRGEFIPEIQHIIDFYDSSKRGVTFWGHSHNLI